MRIRAHGVSARRGRRDRFGAFLSAGALRDQGLVGNVGKTIIIMLSYPIIILCMITKNKLSQYLLGTHYNE